MWASLLLFYVYRGIAKKAQEISFTAKAACVIGLTYAWSLGLVLINMTIYRYFFDKSPLVLDWERYLIIAFSKFFIILGLSILFF